jgi:hypothetical protein
MKEHYLIDEQLSQALRGFGGHFLKHTVGVLLTMLVFALWLSQLFCLYSR